jgi:carboxymethylenebutenolidase
MSAIDHVTTAEVTFPSGASAIRGVLCRARPGVLPAVVLVPDVRGVSVLYRTLGARLAAEGFLTLVLDIYSREGPPDLPDMPAVARWIDSLADDRVLSDISAAVQYLDGSGGGPTGPIGIVGFCLGGQYSFMAACTLAGIAGSVSFYGMLRYTSYSTLKTASPLDLAPHLACPWLGLYGAEDALIPQADVAELRSLLAQNRKTFDIHVYPGAGHAFMNESRPDAYRPAAAADAWPRAVDFLRRQLDRA